MVTHYIFIFIFILCFSYISHININNHSYSYFTQNALQTLSLTHALSHTYTRTYLHTKTYPYVLPHTYTHTFFYTHTHTYTRTYSQTYLQVCGYVASRPAAAVHRTGCDRPWRQSARRRERRHAQGYRFHCVVCVLMLCIVCPVAIYNYFCLYVSLLFYSALIPILLINLMCFFLFYSNKSIIPYHFNLHCICIPRNPPKRFQSWPASPPSVSQK